MKLPFVLASPLLPLLLLPTIVGSPVPLTLPNTLKDLLEQRVVASPVCKCTKKVCTYLLTGFSKSTWSPALFVFVFVFLPCTSPLPHELSGAHVHVCRAFLFYRESLHCRMLSRPARPALHVTPVNGILRSSSAVRWGILRRFLVTTICAAAAEHVQTAFASFVAETTAAEREDAVQFISADQKPRSQNRVRNRSSAYKLVSERNFRRSNMDINLTTCLFILPECVMCGFIEQHMRQFILLFSTSQERIRKYSLQNILIPWI